MLDQEPVRAFVAGAIVLDADQNPAAFELVADEHEFQIALAQLLLGCFVAERRPEAAIPKHDGSAAVLSFWDPPLEVTVIERMILDLDGEAFDFRIE